MKIVVDSNIVFSSLLSKDNTSKLLLTSPKLEIYSCNFLFVEIFKHKDKIQKLSKMTDENILIQLENVISCINFIREDSLPTDIYIQAFDLCKNVDEKDTSFVALSIFIGATLLTGDKELSTALKPSGFNVISISELQRYI